MKTKRWIPLLLCLGLCLCLFPAFAFANASGQCGDNLYWSFDQSTDKLTITGSGAMYDFADNDQPWSSLQQKIFSVELPEGLTSIGTGAFYGCKFLGDILIPESVISIGARAFYATGLDYITIPANVKNIGCEAFAYCEGLRTIEVANGNEYYTAYYGCLFSDNGHTILAAAAWHAESSGSIGFTIPNYVTSIADSAFSCSTYKSITIPNNVTHIGNNAFSRCTKLTTVTIPDSITSISDGMFGGCVGLTSVTIPDSVTYIGDGAFSSCYELTSITIPDSVTYIGEKAFNSCRGLTSFTIPTSVTNIGSGAFNLCTGLTSITVPDSITTISDGIFAGCTGLASVVIPEGTTSIGAEAFCKCTSLSYFYIPNGVTSIGNGAFNGCTGFKSIFIPNSVTDMGSGAFSDCTGLTSINIPDGVTSIDGTFSRCTGLTTITIPNHVTSIDNGAFSGCTGLRYITIPYGVTNIGSYAFSGCTELTSMIIPDSVTCIGYSAFQGCNKLYSLLFGTGIESIGNYAFQGCGSISVKDLCIPKSTTRIGLYAFSDCTSLPGVTILGNIPRIEKGTFYKCSNLKSITIPGTIESVGAYAFEDCSSLKDVYFLGTENEWAQIDFYGANDPLKNANWHFRHLVRIEVKSLPTSIVFAEGEPLNAQSLSGGKLTLYFDTNTTDEIDMTLDMVTGFEPNVVGKQTLTVTYKGCTTSFEVKVEHVSGEPVHENEVPPTCTEEGHYDEVVYCSVCHTEISRTQQIIPALGHAPGEPIRENEVPATTMAEGSYDEVVYCTRCGAELSREHIVIPQLPEPAPTATPTPTPAPTAQAPTIVTQPKDAKAKSGAKAKFTVKTKEKDVTFQWFSKAPKGDWTLMKGETKNTLTVVASGANNGYQYRCLVKNKAGGQVYSNAAKLTVTLQPPVIKTQPKDASVKSGAKAKFTVKASGKNISYQWYERTDSKSEWKLMKGETKNTLQVVASKATDGHQYYCHLKNADGEADSKTAKLTVKTEAPTIKTQPKNLSVKSGKKAKFTVKASGKNLKYQWYERANVDAEWIAVNGGTKNSLSVETSKAKNGCQYYCKVTNPDGAVNSAVVTLTVTPEAPVIKTQPKDAKVKAGGKAKFKVKASPKNVTYQWYYRENENAEWKLIKGATKAEYSFVASAEMFGWQFRCLAKNADGQAWSKAATLLQK